MIQILQDAEALQSLFADPERWTKEVLFKEDENGNDCCYCLTGGIDKVTNVLRPRRAVTSRKSYDRTRELEDLVCAVLKDEFPDALDDGFFIGIPMWNDAPERTIEDVQRVTEKTVEKAKLRV